MRSSHVVVLEQWIDLFSQATVRRNKVCEQRCPRMTAILFLLAVTVVLVYRYVVEVVKRPTS